MTLAILCEHNLIIVRVARSGRGGEGIGETKWRSEVHVHVYRMPVIMAGEIFVFFPPWTVYRNFIAFDFAVQTMNCED